MTPWTVTATDQFQASELIVHNTNGQLVLSKTAPTNLYMRVVAMATYVDINVIGGFGQLTWKFLVNGIPDKTFPVQKDQIGTQNQPMRLGIPIEVPPGKNLDVTIDNSDPVTDYTGGVIMLIEYGRKSYL
jgi:hypothetical protein